MLRLGTLFSLYPALFLSLSPFAVPLSARGPLTLPDPCQPPSLPLFFPIVLLARVRSIDLNFFPRSNREPWEQFLDSSRGGRRRGKPRGKSSDRSTFGLQVRNEWRRRVNAFAAGKTEIEDRERKRQRRQEATVLEGREKREREREREKERKRES